MRILSWTMLISMVLSSGVVLANKVYQYTDENGKTVYSDIPPNQAKNLQEKTLNNNSIQASGVGYGLKEAMRKYPVTLYTDDCGEICDKARAYLGARSIAYTVKNPGKVKADSDDLKKLIGGAGNEVPVLKVGSQVSKGFEEGAWGSLLDAAGYPRGKLTGAAADKKAATPVSKPAAPEPKATPKQGLVPAAAPEKPKNPA
jgi:hypothetical protein